MAFHCIGSESGNFTSAPGEFNGTEKVEQVIFESNRRFHIPLDHPIYDNPGYMDITVVPYNGDVSNSIFYWDSVEDFNNNYIKISGVLDVKFLDKEEDSYSSGNAFPFNASIELYDYYKSIETEEAFPWDYGRVLNHEIGHILGIGHVDEIQNSECNTVDVDLEYESAACFNYDFDDPQPGCNFSNNTMSHGKAQCPCSFTHCQKKTMHANMALQKFPFVDGYDVTGDDYVIYDDEVFDNHVIVPGNLIVHSGAELTITCRVSFNSNSTLIVEKGAKLIVDGGTLTSLTENVEWRGINLEGNGKDQPDPFAELDRRDAGVIILKNFARIENSKTGILCERLGEWWNEDYYGGLIVAENSSFTNNRRGVGFMPMLNDQSRFRNVRFNNKHDGVTLWDNHGVEFTNCRFSNHAINGGIYGNGSTVQVLGTEEVEFNNRFSNNSDAIFLKYSHIPIVGQSTISNNAFDDNEYDIKLMGASNENFILSNEFDNSINGIDINGNNYYKIYDNHFENIDNLAIKSMSSGNARNEINENTFDFNTRSLALNNDNSNTVFLKNCFNSEDYDVFLSEGQVALLIGSSDEAASNCFTDDSNVMDIQAQDMLQFYYYFYNPGFAPLGYCENPSDLDNLWKRDGANTEYACSGFTGFTGSGRCEFDLSVIDVDSLINQMESSIFIMESDTTQVDSLTTVQDSLNLASLNKCLDKVLTEYADSLIVSGNCNEAFQLFDRQRNEYIRIKAYSVLLECNNCVAATAWLQNFTSNNIELQEYTEIQELNQRRYCTQVRPEYTEGELDRINELAQSRNPLGAYARALWHEATGEYISLDLPPIYREQTQPRSSHNSESLKLFTLYPNPATTSIKVVINEDLKDYAVSVFDYSGMPITTKESYLSNMMEIDITTFENGIYFIQVESAEGISLQKFVKH